MENNNYKNNEMYFMVRKFQEAFGHPVADKPTFMPKERVMDRYPWIKEELDEFVEAETLEDQVDALIDTLYLTFGTLVELGVEPYIPFKIVQDANMAKLGSDGKPIYKEDGKIAKPEGWYENHSPEPKLRAEIERQSLKALNNEMLDRVAEDVFNSGGLIIKGANETLAKLYKDEKVISHLQVEELKKGLSTQESSPLVVSNENEEGDK